MISAVLMIVLAVGYRVLAVHEPSLSNFAPLMALTFCGGLYFRDRRLWLVPFAALVLSDLYIDRYYAIQYGYLWTYNAAIVRAFCFAVSLGLGWLVSRQKNWLNLFSGVLGGAVFFYLVTNTQSWFMDLGYAKTLAGWWQAMTVGHPEFAPTVTFFRNSLASDFLFTAAFVLVMEYRALRADQPSLLRRQAA
ncbi:MAG: hypothetical protein JSR48_09995 [Verrucomicrobia bacterium]|nr:hypothetical protein [Verrucomicrobiota bacterium]